MTFHSSVCNNFQSILPNLVSISNMSEKNALILDIATLFILNGDKIKDFEHIIKLLHRSIIEKQNDLTQYLISHISNYVAKIKTNLDASLYKIINNDSINIINNGNDYNNLINTISDFFIRFESQYPSVLDEYGGSNGSKMRSQLINMYKNIYYFISKKESHLFAFAFLGFLHNSSYSYDMFNILVPIYEKYCKKILMNHYFDFKVSDFDFLPDEFECVLKFDSFNANIRESVAYNMFPISYNKRNIANNIVYIDFTKYPSWVYDVINHKIVKAEEHNTTYGNIIDIIGEFVKESGAIISLKVREIISPETAELRSELEQILE